jgi:hypothetical protein
VIAAKYVDRDETYASWGVTTTAYQVDFGTHLAHKSPDTPPEQVGYKQDAYLLTGAADVGEVMAWASNHADGRIVVVYAVAPTPGTGEVCFTSVPIRPPRAESTFACLSILSPERLLSQTR